MNELLFKAVLADDSITTGQPKLPRGIAEPDACIRKRRGRFPFVPFRWIGRGLLKTLFPSTLCCTKGPEQFPCMTVAGKFLSRPI
ncbi:MAG: hypothetical protein CMM74_15780 [Rhodospirillaceae bacterium]|nr:hypothetical protein [Rhodospirillaceae bacterium]